MRVIVACKNCGTEWDINELAWQVDDLDWDTLKFPCPKCGSTQKGFPRMEDEKEITENGC